MKTQTTRNDVGSWDEVETLLDARRLRLACREPTQSAWRYLPDDECDRSYPTYRVYAVLDWQEIASWDCWQVCTYGDTTGGPPHGDWWVCRWDGGHDGARSDEIGDSAVETLAGVFGLDAGSIDNSLADQLYDLCAGVAPSVAPPTRDVGRMWDEGDEITDHVRLSRHWGKTWIVWRVAEGRRQYYQLDAPDEVPDNATLRAIGLTVLAQIRKEVEE